MKLLVIGATKGIGRLVVDEALRRGHQVRGMARSAETLPDAAGLEPYRGDALKPEDVRGALEGCDVVVQALGIEAGVAMIWREVTLFSRATEVLLEEMRETGLRRVIAITGFGAGDSKTAMSLPERLGHRFLLGKPYEDKDRQEAMLRASDADWTIVRPTILTNRPGRGRYKALTEREDWRNGLISRADVARFVLDEVEQDTHRRRAVVVTS